MKRMLCLTSMSSNHPRYPEPFTKGRSYEIMETIRPGFTLIGNYGQPFTILIHMDYFKETNSLLPMMWYRLKSIL